MKHLWLIIIFLSSNPFAQTTVAVMEFETDGLEGISSSALSAIVRREVKNNDDLILLDRRMMDQVLQEQGFQQSGCTSSECAVEVGQLLGVQKMITGSLSALGQLYLVEIFILDVESGMIESSQMFEHIGKVEELIKPLRNNTNKLFTSNKVKSKEETFVYIDSNPAGGMVYLDGKNIGSSPIKYNISPGNYKISIKTKGYQDWMQNTNIISGDKKILSAKLVKLDVSSSNSSNSGVIGEWRFWDVSQEDYISLIQLNITKKEWLKVFKPNNLNVEIIRTYNNLGFPKKLWVKIFLIDIPLEIAVQYYKLSFPIDDWLKVYQSGLTIEDINKLKNNFNLDIENLIGYFKKIDNLGFNNVQSITFDSKTIKWNINFHTLIFSRIGAGSIDQKKLSFDELLEKVSLINSGNDIFFTNDFTKLNKETQQLVYGYYGVNNNYVKVTKIMNDYKSEMIRIWSKNKKGYLYAKPLADNLSVGNILLLYLNQPSQKEISNHLSTYYNFMFEDR